MAPAETRTLQPHKGLLKTGLPFVALLQSTSKYILLEKDQICNCHSSSLPLKSHSLASLNLPSSYPCTLPKDFRTQLTQSVVNTILVVRNCLLQIESIYMNILPYHVNSKQCTSETYHSKSMCCKEIETRCIFIRIIRCRILIFRGTSCTCTCTFVSFYLYSFIHSPISAMQRDLISCLESLKPKKSVNLHVHAHL